jgi:hypothetical protein
MNLPIGNRRQATTVCIISMPSIAVLRAETPRLGSDMRSPSHIVALTAPMYKLKQLLRFAIPLRCNSGTNARVINRKALRETDGPTQRVEQIRCYGSRIAVEDAHGWTDGQIQRGEELGTTADCSDCFAMAPRF